MPDTQKAWEVRCVRTSPDGRHVPQILIVGAETDTEAMQLAAAEIDLLNGATGYIGCWCIERIACIGEMKNKEVIFA